MTSWAFDLTGLVIYHDGQLVMTIPIDQLPGLIVGAAQRIQERSRHGS